MKTLCPRDGFQHGRLCRRSRFERQRTDITVVRGQSRSNQDRCDINGRGFVHDGIADGCYRHRLRSLRRGDPAPRHQRTGGHHCEHGTLNDISHPRRNSSQWNEQQNQQQREQSRLPDKMNQSPTQRINQGQFQRMQDGEHDNLCCRLRIQEHLKQHSQH